MVSLREWLVMHGWFIWFSDPSPSEWCIRALSPVGRQFLFIGTNSNITRVWETADSNDWRSLG